MIRIVNGNILDATEDIIAHQVNCKGAMGAGLAKQIKERWPDVYTDYVVYCSAHHRSGRELLGRIWLTHIFDDVNVVPVTICHLFGQDGYSGASKGTDYRALEKALCRLKKLVESTHESIAIPYKLGCGLGGGDWDGVVYPMIERIFGDSDVLVTIYKMD